MGADRLVNQDPQAVVGLLVAGQTHPFQEGLNVKRLSGPNQVLDLGNCPHNRLNDPLAVPVHVQLIRWAIEDDQDVGVASLSKLSRRNRTEQQNKLRL